MPAGTKSASRTTASADHIAPDLLATRIEEYLTEHPAAAVLEDGRVVFDMRFARYSVTESHGRCVVQFWSEERNVMRTVVGLDRKGCQMTLFIMDGRQPALSIGMTLAELSKELIALGCDNAINLDGGGSTDLVYRDAATRQLKVLNSPSDTRERSVADVLGVSVAGPLAEPK